MAATALEGNFVTITKSLKKDDKVYEKGYIFTIKSVKYESRSPLSSVGIIFSEMQDIIFDPNLDVFEDYPVEMSEKTTLEWFDDSEINKSVRK